ncbi:hypothetical protein FJ567_15840 [Mesorhizobium sp. B2-4-16]|nr:hypothetical protein FJ567_15840 [Mesorhizobium sp. B2-4-16]TPL65260.1 hypothetical protein FJ956_21265 [Mesorhizobium sp. B2-4-3]
MLKAGRGASKRSESCRLSLCFIAGGIKKSASRSFAPPSVLPDISPTRGEISSVAGSASLQRGYDFEPKQKRPAHLAMRGPSSGDQS